MIETSCDVVIIGSGAGGGTVARELSPLCRDGRRIVVLEWGPRFREEEFTGRELEMAGKLYFESGGFLTDTRDMTCAFGRGYGGSTLVYTGTSFPLPDRVARAWDVPGLDPSDIRTRTEKYRIENNVHELAPDRINENNELFRTGCERIGLTARQFPVNVRDCPGAGVCNLGCPNQAMQGTHRVQLPEAERNGVEVVTHCRVDRIGDRCVEARIEPLPFGLPSPWAPGAYRIRAKVVVVCGGAVNSSALLLRSGLGGRLPALGRYFTCHPALTLIARHDRAITNFYGFPKAYYCDAFEETDHFLLETCMYFPFTTAKNIASFGPPHALFLEDFRRLQMILVLASDRAIEENRIGIDGDGNPRIFYTVTDEVRQSFVAAQRVAARIFFAAGAEYVHVPGASVPVLARDMQDGLEQLITLEEFRLGKVPISSAHMMGGCRMGRSSGDSVTDGRGRVHGVAWLYCADSSLFPGSSEVNPYLTVMALADRVAEGIRNDAAGLFST